MEYLEVCAGTENERRGLEDWEKWQTRVTFWKRRTKQNQERDVEEKKKEEKDQLKRSRCEAETQQAAADYQVEETADGLM